MSIREKFRVLFGASSLIATGALGVSPAGCATNLTATTSGRTAGEVVDGELRCSAIAAQAQPLVVDWTDEDRAQLSEAMAGGLAVFRYDCAGLKLLRGCKAQGSYGFAGTSRKEELVRLADRSEVRLNLPTFGGALASSLASRDRTLDVAMVLIGKQRALSTSVGAKQLEGAGACAGATHFLRGAHLGAFALDTGAKGTPRQPSSVFEAHAAGSPLSVRRDGDVRRCAETDPTAVRPPDGCGSFVRLELTKVGTPGGEDAAEDACPSGLVLAEGKCALPTSATAHQCKKTEPNDCVAQCARGHARSCETLSFLLGEGRGVEKDQGRAFEIAQKACDDGASGACFLAGHALHEGRGVRRDPSRAAVLYRRACDDGEMVACWALGSLTKKGLGVPKNAAVAVALYKKACNGAVPGACIALAEVIAADEPVEAAKIVARTCDAGHDAACVSVAKCFLNGIGVPKDAERAAKLAGEVCERKEASACALLGSMHEAGDMEGASAVEARRLLQKACDLGNGPACSDLGVMFNAGKGGEKLPERAAELYARGCDLGFSSGCSNAGLLYSQGKGVAADPARAVSFFERGCEGGDGRSCNFLGEHLESGEGVPKDQKRSAEVYERACELGHAHGCYGLGWLYAKGIGVPQSDTTATSWLRRACRGGNRQACEMLRGAGQSER
ncbi:MAG: sel1 repeat family protein [Myxococcales bacterium]|nr:sel1 repeat family protein [Myxococcales bacterium]MBL0195735.1 sel1 repeat family protein [Myxococcales bacterium]